MSCELFVSILCGEAWPPDYVLDASEAIIEELESQTGRQLDTGGGRGSRDIWLPTENPTTDRRLIADIIGRVAPDVIYTIKVLSGDG
jgi:hypothetical protein